MRYLLALMALLFVIAFAAPTFAEDPAGITVNAGQQKTITVTGVAADSDGDGHPDPIANPDLFPNDPTEWADSDGDGIGNNSDRFPDDPSEGRDTDGDGHGDNSDRFPNDPDEWADADSDGVGDNSDAFPDNPSETKDSDGDGVGNNSDNCPNVPNPDQADLDNDGIGDVGDSDRDGDGVNNDVDYAPGDPNVQNPPNPTIPTTNINSGNDLDQIVNTTSSPRLFKIAPGTYTVDKALDLNTGDKLVGVYTSTRPTIAGNGTVQNILDANGTKGVSISGLRIMGAHGVKANQPNTGRGISGGTNLTLTDVRLTNNDNQGVGGALGGLVIDRSEIDHNGGGSNGAFYAQDGRESAAGIKTVHDATITNSNIHDNYWTGVWGDIKATDLDVSGSTLKDNGRMGIHFEISAATAADPATFEDNIIQGNGLAPYVWGRHGGVVVVNSAFARVVNNTLGQNRDMGVRVFHDASRTSGVVTHDVAVSGNTLNGDTLYIQPGLLNVNASNNP